MTGLGWGAFGCYVAGALIAGVGLIFAYREARAIGIALDDLESAQMPSNLPEGGGMPIPAGQANPFNMHHIGRVTLAMVGNKQQRWRAFALILIGGAVELAGNLLSLPW